MKPNHWCSMSSFVRLFFSPSRLFFFVKIRARDPFISCLTKHVNMWISAEGRKCGHNVAYISSHMCFTNCLDISSEKRHKKKTRRKNYELLVQMSYFVTDNNFVIWRGTGLLRYDSIWHDPKRVKKTKFQKSMLIKMLFLWLKGEKAKKRKKMARNMCNYKSVEIQKDHIEIKKQFVSLCILNKVGNFLFIVRRS